MLNVFLSRHPPPKFKTVAPPNGELEKIVVKPDVSSPAARHSYC